MQVSPDNPFFGFLVDGEINFVYVYRVMFLRK